MISPSHQPRGLVMAFPVETPGTPPDPSLATAIRDPTQLATLCARYAGVLLYGELDGVVFTGDEVTTDHLRDLALWWRMMQ